LRKVKGYHLIANKTSMETQVLKRHFGNHNYEAYLPV